MTQPTPPVPPLYSPCVPPCIPRVSPLPPTPPYSPPHLCGSRRVHFLFGLRSYQAGLFNFRPSVRPVPLEVHISGYPGKHYCPRMATMNKPTFAAIRTHSPAKPALVFVSSRRQTRLTALDLIAFLANEPDAKQWLHMDEAEVRTGTGEEESKNMVKGGGGRGGVGGVFEPRCFARATKPRH